MLVPENSTGHRELDDGANSITEKSCENAPASKMKMFVLHGGEQYRMDSTEADWAQSLVLTKELNTVLGGGAQIEPVPSNGSQPSDRIVLPGNSLFQLYAPVCVYYSDEEGENYASCNTFIFSPSSKIDGASPYSVSCKNGSMTGTFETPFFPASCEK